MRAQVSPLNERLREIRVAKMMVDIIQVNAAAGATQLRKVVQFVCGNAVVCETIKEARRIAFDGRERIKVRLTLGHGYVSRLNPPSKAKTQFFVYMLCCF